MATGPLKPVRNGELMYRTKTRNVSLLLLLAFSMGILGTAILSPGASGQVPTDLFMSEYVEGTSFNKAIEVYNATGASVDLGAQQYIIETYFNGSTSVGLTIDLAGTVADGDVFVVAHSSAVQAVLDHADQTQGGGWFNGNDAILLRKGGAGGTITDRFGRVGEDPGADGWTGPDGYQTANRTLRRKPTIYQGDTASTDEFHPEAQWDMFDVDTFDGLGWHALVPVVNTINPDSAPNSGPVNVSGIHGHFFQNGATAWLQRNSVTINADNVNFISSSQMECDFDITGSAAGDWTVYVQNPAPHGLSSSSGTPVFTVENDVPTIDTIDPTSKLIGSDAFTLTVTGTNFVAGSVVRFDGSDRTTTYVSGTELTIPVYASDMGEATTFDVTVFNPTPGGGESNARTFTVENDVPTIDTIDPTSKLIGSDAFTLTVTGTNFVAGSVVRFDGSDRTTTYVSGTELTIPVYASDMGEATTFDVTVFNPTPGGGESNARTFTVENDVPTITTLSPSSRMEGSSAFTLTVTGTNFVAGSEVLWNGNPLTTTWVSATRVTAAVPAGRVANPGTANVTVFNPTPGGGTSNAQAFTVSSALSTWYLAEGTTAWGFTTYITIENPNAVDLIGNVTYMPRGGAANVEQEVFLPALSQTTITNDALIAATGGQMDFSTRVESSDKTRPIAVDRTMEWTGPGAASPEGHNSIGVTSPEKTWYLPEGSTNWGFETWLSVQNPNNAEATCTLTYMVKGESPQEFTKKVPANSRESFSMADDIGNKDASIQVESNIPVIPERSIYRNSRREGHGSIGPPPRPPSYSLGSPTPAWGFTTSVSKHTPNDSDVDVTVTYMTGDGAKPQVPFKMAPNTRETIRVNDVAGMAGNDFSTRVTGSSPIIAERAMYWGEGTPLGEACHDSIGVPAPAMTFYLPDGQTSDGRETWTCVQNPNGTEVDVTITYLPAGGGDPVVFTKKIPADSRRSFSMAGTDSYPGFQGRASVLVESNTAERPIIVERSMYWNSRGAGTVTIGGHSK